MQHKASIDVVRYALRVKICPKCYQRPPHSETLGPTVARSCEPGCTIFANLPQMHAAMITSSPNFTSDELMQKFVCPSCRCSATAGEFCADGMTRTCPLSRYAPDITQILDDVERTLTIH